MRKSTTIWGPVLLITVYYAVLAAGGLLVIDRFAEHAEYLPIGGIDALLARGADEFEPVRATADAPTLAPYDTVKLALAIVCTILLMVPISWVYFITTRDKDVDTSFAQTIVVLPVIVAGIAMIVHGSLALAFSLAGVVAAVRFRFTLDEPAQALYIFVAIAVGLGAGISAVGVAAVVSVAFVYLTLVLWKVDYGDDLGTPFFSFLTGRGHDDKDL
jgi:Domain of unknown function (DUF4956)